MEEKYQDCEEICRRIKEKRVGEKVRSSPKVSIITPTYQSAEFIRETVDSVFQQTFSDFELIIINDGSPDTEDLEREITDYFERIVYIRQERSGASRARNTGICVSRGQLLAFLDNDDIWYPEFLESQVDFLISNNLDMVYCDALLFGEKLFEGSNFMKKAPSEGPVTTESLITAKCNIITSGTVLRREWLEKFNLFDPDLYDMQDFDLWYRLAKNNAKIGYQKKIMLKYRVRASSLSGSNVARARRSIEALKVIRRKYGLNESEAKSWEAAMAEYEADYEIEQGKFCLTIGEFVKAREHLIKANSHYRKFKLSLIIGLLKVFPRLTQKIFKKFRPAEYRFILPEL
jgi:glycosyltransferase involved in cell wall biosynthesis